MTGIVHGYGLGGAGSNLWTRAIVRALCTNGETVHLVCQEPNPDRYDFISELWVYDDEARPEQRFQRPCDYPGSCIMHRPTLNVLPTYVRPDRESEYVKSILDLERPALDEYVDRNVRALRVIAERSGVRAWHVNHTILMTEALRQLQPEGVRFAVMPHGSALEYVVQHDQRMKAVAHRVMKSADRIFSLNQEVRDRLARYFPDLELETKTITVRVGVDTERFSPVPRTERRASVERLAESLEGAPRGRRPEHAAHLERAVGAADSHQAFQSALEPALDYQTDEPDADLEQRLREVDWDRDRIISFVGRLIPAKGIPALIAAFPLILERHPHARLLMVGAGWIREYMEAYSIALSRGDGDTAFHIMEWATERKQEGARPSGLAFLQRLREEGRWEGYVAAAERHLTPDRILFTGFLEHHFLAHVFPLSDVAVFPSAVAEASPLVVPEAAACGCLPMGTDFAGMHHSLASLAPRLPEPLRELMRLDPDPQNTAASIVDNVNRALDAEEDPLESLRAAAVQEYDWRRIARLVTEELNRLGSETGAPSPS